MPRVPMFPTLGNHKYGCGLKKADDTRGAVELVLILTSIFVPFPFFAAASPSIRFLWNGVGGWVPRVLFSTMITTAHSHVLYHIFSLSSPLLTVTGSMARWQTHMQQQGGWTRQVLLNSSTWSDSWGGERSWTQVEAMRLFCFFYSTVRCTERLLL